jgi:hypothetical protein
VTTTYVGSCNEAQANGGMIKTRKVQFAGGQQMEMNERLTSLDVKTPFQILLGG